MSKSSLKWSVTVEGGNKLLDHVIAKMQLKNDAALSRQLEVNPPVISKIRHGKLMPGATMFISIHEVTEMTIAEIRAIVEQVRV